MIGGESAPFIETLDFTSKRQLLYKMHRMEEKTATLPQRDRLIVSEIISAAIQELAYISEQEILRYKRYAAYKRQNKPPKQ